MSDYLIHPSPPASNQAPRRPQFTFSSTSMPAPVPVITASTPPSSVRRALQKALHDASDIGSDGCISEEELSSPSTESLNVDSLNVSFPRPNFTVSDTRRLINDGHPENTPIKAFGQNKRKLPQIESLLFSDLDDDIYPSSSPERRRTAGCRGDQRDDVDMVDQYEQLSRHRDEQLEQRLKEESSSVTSKLMEDKDTQFHAICILFLTSVSHHEEQGSTILADHAAAAFAQTQKQIDENSRDELRRRFPTEGSRSKKKMDRSHVRMILEDIEAISEIHGNKVARDSLIQFPLWHTQPQPKTDVVIGGKQPRIKRRKSSARRV